MDKEMRDLQQLAKTLQNHPQVCSQRLFAPLHRYRLIFTCGQGCCWLVACRLDAFSFCRRFGFVFRLGLHCVTLLCYSSVSKRECIPRGCYPATALLEYRLYTSNFGVQTVHTALLE